MGGNLVLVDERDTPIGVGEKLAVHHQGQLHRAFSILVFGEPGLLLQQRAHGKYHSGNLWSNTCCGHPGPGEATLVAGRRRLREEMGLDCELTEALQVTYRLELTGGLVEHELNHVMLGWTEGTPTPDSVEVAHWRWIKPLAFQDALRTSPKTFTAWVPLVWTALLAWSTTDPSGLAPALGRAVSSLARVARENMPS